MSGKRKGCLLCLREQRQHETLYCRRAISLQPSFHLKFLFDPGEGSGPRPHVLAIPSVQI